MGRKDTSLLAHWGRKVIIMPSPTFFPWLDGEARDRADQELMEYLDLVIRIRESHLTRTGQLSPADPLTGSGVLAHFVRPISGQPLSLPIHDPLLRISARVDDEAGRTRRVT
jgi:hypothetical protein